MGLGLARGQDFKFLSLPRAISRFSLRKSGHRGHLNRVIVDTKIAMMDSDIGMVDSDIGHRGQWV